MLTKKIISFSVRTSRKAFFTHSKTHVLSSLVFINGDTDGAMSTVCTRLISVNNKNSSIARGASYVIDFYFRHGSLASGDVFRDTFSCVLRRRFSATSQVCFQLRLCHSRLFPLLFASSTHWHSIFPINPTSVSKRSPSTREQTLDICFDLIGMAACFKYFIKYQLCVQALRCIMNEAVCT